MHVWRTTFYAYWYGQCESEQSDGCIRVITSHKLHYLHVASPRRNPLTHSLITTFSCLIIAHTDNRNKRRLKWNTTDWIISKISITAQTCNGNDPRLAASASCLCQSLDRLHSWSKIWSDVLCTIFVFMGANNFLT